MVDVFQEVDEALKQEKLERIWHDHKNTIISAIVVLIVSTGATSYYKSWDAKRDKQETAGLIEAIQSNDAVAAMEAFSKDTRTGHKAIAQLNQAALLLDQDKTTEAGEIYKNLARQNSTPDALRDLARVLTVRFSAEPTRIDFVKDLIENKESAFYWHANLEAASFYAHEQKDYEKALSYLTAFQGNEAIPSGLKQQADALQAVYSQKALSNAKIEPENKTQTN